MNNLDIAVLDPTAQLANCLGRLITKLGVRFGWAASLPALLALLGDAGPKLLLLSDGVRAEDTQLLRKRFPRAKLAMVYGVAPAAEFTTAAAAILAAIRLDALRWKFGHARKLLKHFVCEHVLAPRRGLVMMTIDWIC